MVPHACAPVFAPRAVRSTQGPVGPSGFPGATGADGQPGASSGGLGFQPSGTLRYTPTEGTPAATVPSGVDLPANVVLVTPGGPVEAGPTPGTLKILQQGLYQVQYWAVFVEGAVTTALQLNGDPIAIGTVGPVPASCQISASATLSMGPDDVVSVANVSGVTVTLHTATAGASPFCLLVQPLQ